MGMIGSVGKQTGSLLRYTDTVHMYVCTYMQLCSTSLHNTPIKDLRDGVCSCCASRGNLLVCMAI